MTHTLNITNGDSAVAIMQQAGIAGDFLPWRDILHDGPVPEKLSLEALSKIRSAFIAASGWGNAENIHRSFVERDQTLASYADYEKIILWFEHDLYDQLQILQILDWFHQHANAETRLFLICVDRYLGLLTPDEMAALYQYEVPVEGTHLELAHRSWAAFREKTPENWAGLLQYDTGALPFLEGVIVRMLEEFPDVSSGLSRTGRQALQIIATGETDRRKVFSRNQELEERIFLGDSSFWAILDGFQACSSPLLEMSDDEALTLSATGSDVLSGKQNWLDIKAPDRWIGGTHLTRDNIWILHQTDPVKILRRVEAV